MKNTIKYIISLFSLIILSNSIVFSQQIERYVFSSGGNTEQVGKKLSHTFGQMWASYTQPVLGLNLTQGFQQPDTISSQNTTSILSNIFNNSQILIYPNPANEFMSIEFDGMIQSKIEIEIFDLNGRKIQHLQSQFSTLNQSTDKIVIDVSSLTSGLYFLRLSSLNEMKTIKFEVIN